LFENKEAKKLQFLTWHQRGCARGTACVLGVSPASARTNTVRHIAECISGIVWLARGDFVLV
jgi:hypothetical protein